MMDNGDLLSSAALLAGPWVALRGAQENAPKVQFD